MKPSPIIVISDIHVGAGELDDCAPELEQHIVDFLVWCSDATQCHQVVINGDFLDFVQASPWRGADLRSYSPEGVDLCFSEAQSREKLKNIVAAHPAIFSAMRGFLEASNNNRFVILPGNHDVDLFWPSVRADLTTTVCAENHALRDRLCFHLERSYRPEEVPAVWIEHGHQYDVCNRFFVHDIECWAQSKPPILSDITGTKRLLECTGTMFLNRYLNYLDAVSPSSTTSSRLPGWSRSCSTRPDIHSTAS